MGEHEKMLKAIAETEAWLELDSTWENDLDGYDRLDVAQAILRRLKEKLSTQQPSTNN